VIDSLRREDAMKYLWLTALSVVYSVILACTPAERIDVTLRNHTPAPIQIRAKAAGFSRIIRLKPGEKFEGWLPRMMVESIEITLEPK